MPGPIKLEVVFIMKRPKYMQAKKWSEGRIFHDKRPDIDNLLKMVADGLQPQIIADDAKIVMVTASKFYAAKNEKPCTKIMLHSIDQLL